MAKLLLALALLVLSGVGGAQRNPPQVTKYPDLTDIEVEWMQFIPLRFEVCDDEEPRVNYTFEVNFVLNNETNTPNTSRCTGPERTLDDIVTNGFACTIKNTNQSCQQVIIGAWNKHEYENLYISIDIFEYSDPAPIEVSYDGNFSLAFLQDPMTPPTIFTPGTAPSCPNSASGNAEREGEGDLAAGISVPAIIIIVVLLVVVIIMSVIIIRQYNNSNSKIAPSS